MKDEMLLYRADELTARIEVTIKEETVWLNRNQIAALFDRDVKTIGKHLNNLFSDEELDKKSSKKGTQFRIWANQILKDYLLKGYSLNNRMNRIEDNLQNLSTKVDAIDIQINASLPPNQDIFFQGQIFDAYTFVCCLIKTAKTSIILIDNYIDDSVLTHFSKRDDSVDFMILVKNISKQLKLDIKKHNEQYPVVVAKEFKDAHDRFLIIDEKEIYHFGASLKELGKKWFAFSKIDISSVKILDKLKEGGLI